MENINIVINGDYKGKNITSSFSSISIQVGSFNSESINTKNVENIKIIKEEHSKKEGLIYIIDVKFKSEKKSIIRINQEIYNKLIEIYPELHIDKLTSLLKNGYKIVGYSSCMMSAGAMADNILLQKDTNVEKITIITIGKEQKDGYHHIFAPYDFT